VDSHHPPPLQRHAPSYTASFLTHWVPTLRQSDRWYYRLLTPDNQVFEVYRDATSAGLWVLDVVQD
jgi:hypothetical protein